MASTNQSGGRTQEVLWHWLPLATKAADDRRSPWAGYAPSGVSLVPAPKLQRVAAAVVVVALTVGVGTVIGTEIGHRPAASQLKDQAERQRAIGAA